MVDANDLPRVPCEAFGAEAAEALELDRLGSELEDEVLVMRPLTAGLGSFSKVTWLGRTKTPEEVRQVK